MQVEDEGHVEDPPPITDDLDLASRRRLRSASASHSRTAPTRIERRARDFTAIDVEELPSAERVAPLSAIPAASDLFAIHYPGYIAAEDTISVDAAPHSASIPSASPALCKALASLSPDPAPYATPEGALTHIAHLVDLSATVLECRLPSNPSADKPSRVTLLKEIFRHPILGDINSSRNIVLSITKRKWKRIRKSNDAVPAQEADKVTSRDVKEYTVRAIGVACHTAKFDRMADYAFTPSVSLDESERLGVSESQLSLLDAHGGEVSINPTVTIADAIRRMDFDVLARANLGALHQIYDVPAGDGRSKRSVQRMIPPPLFSRAKNPLDYNYKQNVASSRVEVTNSDGSKYVRWANRNRQKSLLPQILVMGKENMRVGEPPVPTEPTEQIKAMRDDCSEELLQKLEQMFEERPIWSRLAIDNQLTLKQKQVLSRVPAHLYLLSYQIRKGPWRHVFCRHDYDPRAEVDARIYQRVQTRFIDPTPVNTRAVFKSSYGRGKEQSKGLLDVNEDDEQGDDLGGEPSRRRPPPAMKVARNSHVFDGEQLARKEGSYLLCDITDPVVVRYIDPDDEDGTDEEGPKLRTREEGPSAVSGWYTRAAWERIFFSFRHRLASLHDGKGPTREIDTIHEVEKHMRGFLARVGQTNDDDGLDESEDGDEWGEGGEDQGDDSGG